MITPAVGLKLPVIRRLRITCQIPTPILPTNCSPALPVRFYVTIFPVYSPANSLFTNRLYIRPPSTPFAYFPFHNTPLSRPIHPSKLSPLSPSTPSATCPDYRSPPVLPSQSLKQFPDESTNPPFPKMIRSFRLGLPPTHHFTHGIPSREKLLSEFPTVLSFTIIFSLRQSRSAGFHTVCHLGSISPRLLADCVLGTQHEPLSVPTLVNPSISRPSPPSRCNRYTTRCPIRLSSPVTSRPRKCRSAFSVSSATLHCKNRDFRVHSRTDIESASRCWSSCGVQSKHA